METNLASQPENPSLIKYGNGNENGNGVDVSVGVNATSKAKDLIDLPLDIFVIIAQFLAPQDIILSRRVSRAWHVAFTDAIACHRFMTCHFPRSREMRSAGDGGRKIDWARAFATVARRYFHLRAARPRLVEKIDVVREGSAGFRGVPSWDRWLRWDDHTAPFQYPDTTWSADGGLLVYQEGASRRWVAYDLETRRLFDVPFDAKGRIVRRQRLGDGVLVFEWCQRFAVYSLDTMEMAYRHFATAFDVRRRRGGEDSEESRVGEWDITFRCEWKIIAQDLPLDDNDRFFSSHTATHYALYLWQPDRSSWLIDPLEELAVWDISQPSTYRPSLDMAEATKHIPDGPSLVKKFSRRDLEFLGLRQRYTPSIREVRLDEANVYVHSEEHRWLAGQHASLSPPRHHQVRCTGIPFSGAAGPRWFDECCADGDVHMSFCPRAGSLARILGRARLSGGEDGQLWPGWAPCWRHEEFPYLTVSDAVDAGAGVRVVARQCFIMEALSSFVLPKISVLEELEQDVLAGVGEGEEAGGEGEGDGDLVAEVRFPDEMWWELMGKGKIVGDERWVVGEDGDGRVTVVRF
ncbi:hypothetical protein F4813DRAFT_361836 [Daldinia decipiens]|uniref:uncharacterized protein n=1 Tax=Daldinia decipiens TaxID=326647 RepID=UPI0020C1D57E|nr:uncharacterized protein F4813DRAFT_361836 [Daldinia decipiens]KAI1657156.1 hypothetical protein F4813DRAFT_361836 [Daldinia decipiens]